MRAGAHPAIPTGRERVVAVAALADPTVASMDRDFALPVACDFRRARDRLGLRREPRGAPGDTDLPALYSMADRLIIAACAMLVGQTEFDPGHSPRAGPA